MEINKCWHNCTDIIVQTSLLMSFLHKYRSLNTLSLVQRYLHVSPHFKKVHEINGDEEHCDFSVQVHHFD